MICVVSVVDSVSATSMPINEFVIYRSEHKYPIRQILLVADSVGAEKVSLPEDVEVFFTENKASKIRKAVGEIEKKCKKEGIKTVYHLHHQRSACKFFLATAFMGIKKKTLFTVHSTYRDRDFVYKSTSIFCTLSAKIANCVSESALKDYSALIKALKGDRFICVLNGVDTERIDKVSPFKEERNEKTLISVGRLIPLKNHAFLIDVLKKLPDLRLVLIGAEDSAASVEKKAEELGVFDRVSFCGQVAREEVFSRLKSASVYLSASTVEGMPVSVLEAAYAGNIPVLSDIGPHKEIAKNCDNVFVLPFSVDIWAEKISEILNDCRIDERREMLKKEISEKFSLAKMHEKYFTVYEKLAK